MFLSVISLYLNTQNKWLSSVQSPNHNVCLNHEKTPGGPCGQACGYCELLQTDISTLQWQSVTIGPWDVSLILKQFCISLRPDPLLPTCIDRSGTSLLPPTTRCGPPYVLILIWSKCYFFYKVKTYQIFRVIKRCVQTGREAKKWLC